MSFLLLFLLSACSSQEDNKNSLSAPETAVEEPHPLEGVECGYDIGDVACNFEYKDQHEELVGLWDFYEKPIILDFSTMWCYYCNVAAYFEFRVVEEVGSEDLVWVTVLVENEEGQPPSSEDCQKWANDYALEQPVLAGDYDVLEQGYSVEAWPTFFIINKEMVIIDVIVGWDGPTIVEATKEAL